jgi:hypothetical protein
MYLKSSEIQPINGKNYLRVYLEKDYSFLVKHNDQEISMNNVLLEEPTSDDMAMLKRLAVSIEKLFTYISAIKPLQIVSYINSDLMNDLNSYRDNQDQTDDEIPQEISEQIEKLTAVEKARIFVRDVFLKSNDYQTNETDYYIELQKFIDFLQNKLYRELDDGLVLKLSFDVFEKYLSESFIIKEELIIEYFSFFFAHLPSRSLQVSVKN